MTKRRRGFLGRSKPTGVKGAKARTSGAERLASPERPETALGFAMAKAGLVPSKRTTATESVNGGRPRKASEPRQQDLGSRGRTLGSSTAKHGQRATNEQRPKSGKPPTAPPLLTYLPAS